MEFKLLQGHNVAALKSFPDNHFDSVVTDAPYGLSREPDMAEVLKHWLAGDDYVHNGSGFMGKSWDSFVPGPAIWRECLRVLKPGGHLVCFFGSRTYDMGALAIRLAGFEIRDQMMWLYGSGFPKSLDVSKAIDKAAGARREVVGRRTDGRYAYGFSEQAKQAQGGTVHEHSAGWVGEVGVITAPATEDAAKWEGWGTALKPAHEPICLARKPLSEPTVAANVLRWGVGALNIGACRIGTDGEALRTGAGTTFDAMHQHEGRAGQSSAERHAAAGGATTFAPAPGPRGGDPAGRWPANVLHDGSEPVVAIFPAEAGGHAGVKGTEPSGASVGRIMNIRHRVESAFHSDTGSAARFFYCAKASKVDREEGTAALALRLVGASKQAQAEIARGNADHAAQSGMNTVHERRNIHPTVKPTALMRHLVELVTPPGGKCIDVFCGSGSTGKACAQLEVDFVGIDLDRDDEGEPLGYLDIAAARITHERRRVAAERAAAAVKPLQVEMFQAAMA